jgi:hypothetical protein
LLSQRLPNVNIPNPKGSHAAEFWMISYLATIAFAAKQHKSLIVPEKSSHGFVLWRCGGLTPGSFVLWVFGSRHLTEIGFFLGILRQILPREYFLKSDC